MKIIFVVILLVTSSFAHAKYFFMISDNKQTPCKITPLNTQREIERVLGSVPGITCTGVEDTKGTIVMTCKLAGGQVANMSVYTVTEASCKSLHGSFKTMLNNM